MSNHNTYGGALLALLLAAAGGGAQAAYRVGAAALTITPDPPTGQWLAGYGDPEDHRVSEGAHDDIWCRALAVSDGETTVVFAAVDLIGLFYPEVRNIAARVPGLAPEHLLLGATHVHSAPDVLGLWGPADDRSGVDPAYLEHVRARSAQAVEQALAAMEPARLAFATGLSPERTSFNYNDAWTIDNALTVMQARRANGEVIATLVNWACHPEVMTTPNRQITSDYVHYLRDEVEADQGGVCVFMNGALGGMVSPVDDQEDTWEGCERIGRAVGAEVCSILGDAAPIEPAPIRLAYRQFETPMGNPGFQALKAVGVLNRGGDEPEGRIVTATAAVGIGPAQFVTMPGEALPAVGFRIRTMMDAPVQFLLGLTLDELGYILPAEALGMRKYRYEESMSVDPGFADLLVAQARLVLDAIEPER